MEEGQEEKTSPEPDQWFAKEKLYKVGKLLMPLNLPYMPLASSSHFDQPKFKVLNHSST